MTVDLTLPENGWDPALYYWLSCINWFNTAGPAGLPEDLANIPGPATHGQVSFVLADPTGLEWSGNLRMRWIDYGEWLVLAIHGIQLIPGDFLLCTLAYPQGAYTGIHGFVHNVWAAMAFEFRRVLTPVLQALPGSGRKVLLTGHSMGGAVAQILSHLLDGYLGLQPRGVVAFGAPMPGNIGFAEMTAWPVVRIDNRGDVVPYLPYSVRPSFLRPIRRAVADLAWVYSPVGRGWVLAADGRLASSELGFWTGDYAPAFTPDDSGNASVWDLYHNQVFYIERVRSHLRFDLGAEGRGFERLWQADQVIAAEWQTLGRNWGFPSSYPLAYAAGSSNWGQVSRTLSYTPSHCPGTPGSRCCSQ